MARSVTLSLKTASEVWTPMREGLDIWAEIKSAGLRLDGVYVSLTRLVSTLFRENHWSTYFIVRIPANYRGQREIHRALILVPY